METFIVKHYTGHDRPVIKGNGFDGLEIGKNKEEAEDFIYLINELIQQNKDLKEENNSADHCKTTTTKKKYIMFGFYSHQEEGGMNDVQGSFDTIKEAAEELVRLWEYGSVVDRDTWEEVFYYSNGLPLADAD